MYTLYEAVPLTLSLLAFRACTGVDLQTRGASQQHAKYEDSNRQSLLHQNIALSTLHHNQRTESLLWNLAALEARVSALEPAEANLLLREMASQLENKLARL